MEALPPAVPLTGSRLTDPQIDARATVEKTVEPVHIGHRRRIEQRGGHVRIARPGDGVGNRRGARKRIGVSPRSDGYHAKCQAESRAHGAAAYTGKC